MMNGYMGSQIVKEISEARGVKKMTDIEVAKLRMSVKIIMWKYYSENKSQLSEYVREFREDIIVQLMKGESVEDVFDSFGGVIDPATQLSGVAA